MRLLLARLNFKDQRIETNMRDDSMLVLGAGELGMAVLRNLAQHPGLQNKGAVSVLLRPATIAAQEPAKRRDLDELHALGIEIIPGDIAASSQEELAAVLRPFHTVISCTGFVGGSGTLRKLAEAVLQAGVRRYLPWQFGVHYDVIGRGSAQNLFDEQLDVRELLRVQSATEWVIVSTGMFTSFLFEPSFGVVDLPGNTMHALGSFDTAVTVTTAEDIGALTAEILVAAPRIRNQVVYTAGDTLTYRRLADLIDLVLERKIERTEWTVPALKEQLAGDPQDALKKYRVVFAQGKGVSWPVAQTFNARNGISVTGVEKWIRDNLADRRA